MVRDEIWRGGGCIILDWTKVSALNPKDFDAARFYCLFGVFYALSPVPLKGVGRNYLFCQVVFDDEKSIELISRL